MRAGSITGAAKLLTISQPAVSKMLHRMEDQIQMQLFVNQKGKLYPTEKAAHLFVFADEIFRNVEKMKQAVFDIRDSRIGRLQIVTNSTIAESLLAKPISKFLTSFPRFSISLKPLPNNQIINRVALQQADVGVFFGPADVPFVEQHDLCRVPVMCAINQNHRLSAKPVVTLADLADERIITFHRNAFYGQVVWDALQAEGVEPDSLIECNHSTAALVLVQAGAGIALMPALPSEALAYSYVSLRRIEPAMDILLQYLLPLTSSRHPALERFIDYVQAEIAGSGLVDGRRGKS